MNDDTPARRDSGTEQAKTLRLEILGTPEEAGNVPPNSLMVNVSDPITAAVETLFGLSYLFPYQRLVVANILEAAEAAGIPIHWPTAAAEEADPPFAEPIPSYAGEPGAESNMPEEAAEDQDRFSRGRQIVILPTGAGKSLCFQLPAMLLEGPTLVIYPILSLMADQERRLRERGFSPVILRGGQSREEREAIWEKLRSGQSRFIIANPEVLLTPQVLEKLGGLGIVHVVIDEAHCVSEWGESFRPSYLEIGKIIETAKTPGKAGPLVTAFTATASDPVMAKIERYIFGKADSPTGAGNNTTGAHRIIGNPDRSNIEYAAQGCLLRDLAVRDLIKCNRRPAIVFCSSRPGTEKLARYLRNELAECGDPGAAEIRFYHAGLSREEKAVVEKWFFDSPDGVLVATCAYGMGIDKANIRTVIHRDCPPSVEAYLQESGRAGRDGLASRAVLLWGPDDDRAITRAKSEADRRRLFSLMEYSRNTGVCRREALLALLNYEGGGESPESGCCDVCEGTAQAQSREEASLLGFFKRNKRRYRVGEAVKILSGIDHLDWSDEDAKQAVAQLLWRRSIREMRYFPWKGKLTVPRTGK